MSNSVDPFLTERVRRFAEGNGLLGGTALLFRTVIAAALGHLRLEATSPSYALHAVAVLLTVPALFLLRPELEARAVRAIEAFLLLSVSAAYSMMALSIPDVARPEMYAVMAMSFVAITRAIVVPSSGRRTAVLTALAGVPILAAATVIALRTPLEPLKYVVLSMTVMWWTIATISAASASRTIYDLREEVKTARQLGQYTLLSKIGAGGMGEVWAARHALLRRPTALKLMLPERTRPEDAARFEREVQLTSSLTHPNTVTVFDYGRTPDGLFYYAMELLDGLDLGKIVASHGALPAARVVHVLRQVLSALGEAHEAGLVHRDIKPENILLCRVGGAWDFAKVVDFGLVMEPTRQGGDKSVLGTPLWLAPEAITNPGEVGPAVDLYALGAVAFYLLTGRPPFVAPTAIEVIAKHLREPAPRPSDLVRTPIPEELDRLVVSCLSKRPEDRPKDAAAMLEVLEGLSLGWSQSEARRAWAEASPASTPRLATTSRTLDIDVAARAV